VNTLDNNKLIQMTRDSIDLVLVRLQIEQLESCRPLTPAKRDMLDRLTRVRDILTECGGGYDA
jgi:hypothetical protein